MIEMNDLEDLNGNELDVYEWCPVIYIFLN